ncbi:hypothetical protein DW203_00020 [Citrobacter portucalensis]|uniref:hypothetical protein n=1 Tax=Citrobacter TaxID=544 RepID=UPI00038FB094|nr:MULTISPECIES: hypothetical protein [Citrobacter]QNM16278.1 hypothetical protein CXM87_12410 [Citrobacter freundii]EQM94201.1 hypothetical protein CSAG_04733 [Citrobacter portucalensis]KLV75228.1 hypothetical protein SK38_01076 [Citrobacter sp. MGH110]MDE9688787.1 hypothetical protein [Citrobacter portucalensis]MDQ9157096.1 hypothetical protein [Citrobacter portucalensis]
MINDIIFDEALYPMAWRLNSEDCRLTSEDKRKVVFLGEVESENLWDLFFPFKKLMDIDYSFMSLLEKRELDFDEVKESAIFFSDKLNDVSILFFFWGRNDCAIIPSDVLIKAWDDFFYPSDETCIILIPNRDKIIYSYEENFFYARKNG